MTTNPIPEREQQALALANLEPSKIRAAVDFFGPLSGWHRLHLLCLLTAGENSVGDLARLSAMRDTATSQQLAHLRHAGLVRSRRDGKTVFYSLTPATGRRLANAVQAALGDDPSAPAAQEIIEIIRDTQLDVAGDGPHKGLPYIPEDSARATADAILGRFPLAFADAPRPTSAPVVGGKGAGDCADAHRRHSATPEPASGLDPHGRVSTIAGGETDA